ncbi:protein STRICTOSIDINE SYNTHASE-LIKE 10-like [Miscanthus floridulus]|uniref:protein STRICTOSIDINE SYNTHASE-LIKE 10-like n=1 Tax=Miscanthus floridulus TaxID=154761 RepID=UPI003457B91C
MKTATQRGEDGRGRRSRRRRAWRRRPPGVTRDVAAAAGACAEAPERASKGGAKVRPRPVAETTPEAAELAAFGQRTTMKENQRRVVGMRRENELDRCRGSQDPGREHECGRPLGLKLNHHTGELYVADAYHGLRVVSPDNDDKVSRPVAPQWWRGTGRTFSFANGVEVDPDTGAVYFTETSTRSQRREFLRIVISGDTTGRLLRYDPKSGGEVEVLVDGLAFPNGLAMSRDGTHLLLAVTTTGRILRYWLRPAAKAPAIEEVARLPWFPDNIRMSPRGGFWVGLHAKRGKLAEWCISYPWLGRLVLSLPTRHVQRASWLLNRLGRQVIAVRLSEEDGKVMEMVSVHGDLQKTFRSVSEVEERNGSLWIGSVMSPFLGVYKL